jgi:hypothetical protein
LWQQWNAGNVAPAFGTPAELAEAETLATDPKLTTP